MSAVHKKAMDRFLQGNVSAPPSLGRYVPMRPEQSISGLPVRAARCCGLSRGVTAPNEHGLGGVTCLPEVRYYTRVTCKRFAQDLLYVRTVHMRDPQQRRARRRLQMGADAAFLVGFSRPRMLSRQSRSAFQGVRSWSRGGEHGLGVVASASSALAAHGGALHTIPRRSWRNQRWLLAMAARTVVAASVGDQPWSSRRGRMRLTRRGGGDGWMRLPYVSVSILTAFPIKCFRQCPCARLFAPAPPTTPDLPWNVQPLCLAQQGTTRGSAVVLPTSKSRGEDRDTHTERHIPTTPTQLLQHYSGYESMEAPTGRALSSELTCDNPLCHHPRSWVPNLSCPVQTIAVHASVRSARNTGFRIRRTTNTCNWPAPCQWRAGNTALPTYL